MDVKPTCEKCGQEMEWNAEWRYYECDCGNVLIIRRMPLPENAAEGDSPWDLLRKNPIKLDE